MNCHRARLTMIERDSGDVSLGFERSLEAHLEGCAACRAYQQAGVQLLDDLRAWGADDSTPAVDVKQQLLERIALERPRQEGWVSTREHRWAFAATLLAAAMLSIGIIGDGVWLNWLLGATLSVGKLVFSLLGSLWSILAQLLVLPWKLIFGFAETIGTVAAAVGMASVALMTISIVWIVGNDLRKPVASDRRGS